MTFGDWKQSRVQHVFAAKQQDPNTCDGQCVQWAWLYLAECVCGTVQVAGWCLVGTAIFLSIPSHLRTKTAFSESVPNTLGIFIVSLFIHIVSLTGALLSMQMVLVIAHDVMALMVDVLLVVTLLGGRVIRRHNSKSIRNRDGNRHQPQTPSKECKGQANRRRESLWRILSYSAISLTLATLVCVVQDAEFTKNQRDLLFPVTRDFTQDNTAISLQEVFMVIGYAMGSLACFGQWAFQWNNIRLKQESQKDVPILGHSKMILVSRILLVVSSCLYVTGILLQSGGWMVVMVTLPWTVKSFVGANAECYEIFLSYRFRCQYRKVNNTDDSDVISLTESGSDTSNILWDRAWKDRTGLDEFPYYEKAKPKCFDVQAMRLISNDISTNSDWSSSSDEQELEWEDANIAPYNTPSKERKIRMERIVNSTPPRSIPLTLTMPESSDQRIITWISNSTPEEEKSPALTLALNLDSPTKTPNDLSLVSDSRMFPHNLSPRKYSL